MRTRSFSSNISRCESHVVKIVCGFCVDMCVRSGGGICGYMQICWDVIQIVHSEEFLLNQNWFNLAWVVQVYKTGFRFIVRVVSPEIPRIAPLNSLP